MSTAHTTMAQALAKSARKVTWTAIPRMFPPKTLFCINIPPAPGRSKGAELTHLGILTNAYQANPMTEHVMSPDGEDIPDCAAALSYHSIYADFHRGSGQRWPSDSGAKPTPAVQPQGGVGETRLHGLQASTRSMRR